MGKSVGSLQFGDMVYQPELADIFTIDGILPSLEGYTMLPDVSMTIFPFYAAHDCRDWNTTGDL